MLITSSSEIAATPANAVATPANVLDLKLSPAFARLSTAQGEETVERRRGKEVATWGKE